MSSPRSPRRCPLSRLRRLLAKDTGLDGDLRALGLAYVREAEKLTSDSNMFERGEAAAVCVLALRSSERIHGDEAAQAFVDRLERSLRATGLRGGRAVLPAGARRRPGYMREFPAVRGNRDSEQ